MGNVHHLTFVILWHQVHLTLLSAQFDVYLEVRESLTPLCAYTHRVMALRTHTHTPDTYINTHTHKYKHIHTDTYTHTHLIVAILGLNVKCCVAMSILHKEERHSV